MSDQIAAAATELSARDLDLLSYPRKVRHWMREDAWNPGGVRLRFQNPPSAGFRCMMNGGDITRSTLLIGRPCFGIITAFLRYRDAMKMVKGRGMQPASRCGSCNLRKECERVVRNRIRASPALQEAHQQWLLAEGPSSFGRPDWKSTHAYRTWAKLCRAACDADFSSVNDAAVAEHYRSMDENALVSDRLRQQRSRRKEQAQGTLDDAHLFDIQVAAAYRLDDLVQALAEDDPPRALRLLPAKSLVEMMEVWVCRTLLIAMHVKASAPAIARLIAHWGWRNDSSTMGALNSRVARDISRIERFERMPWSGWVLLPPFDEALEFAS